ncbi:hypothetical protein MKW94_009114 [Papaver nudicaule]|uniref:RecQ-mediated genome instability protein 1 n=1 Tax=Papaver nudicaule TaxID=74823 RepID=A0AA41RKF0_PAPNU|nr:hypothetical protein [Papaver nudicaule]
MKTSEVIPLEISPPIPKRLGYWELLWIELENKWLNSCVSELNNSIPGFGNLSVADKGEYIIQKFLFSDIKFSGGGAVLPENVNTLPEVELPGPFVLQVNDISNAFYSSRIKYQDVPPGISRRLELSMTDGVQCVVGVEYRRIEDLHVFAPAGLKVVISNVTVRNGRLMLVPQVLKVLGGKVEELEAARRKLIEEVNNLPRSTTIAASESINDADGSANGVVADRSTWLDATSSEMTEQEEETEIPNVEYNTTSGVAAGFNINVVDVTAAMSDIDVAGDESAGPGRRPNMERNPFCNAIDNSHRLTGDTEIPFTYLAVLLSDWAEKMDDAPRILTKIKCVLTAICGFVFDYGTKYGFLVSVTDGSLTSEVCIDHKIVRSQTGYSPEEISAALSSPDRLYVGKAKEEALLAFETMLFRFRGTMLLEMKKNSTVPVALEMNESAIDDSWFLTGMHMSRK